MAKKKNFLKIFGIVLMVLATIIVISVLPILPQSIVSLGELSIEVSEFSATRLAVGVILFFLGLWAYKSK